MSTWEPSPGRIPPIPPSPPGPDAPTPPTGTATTYAPASSAPPSYAAATSTGATRWGATTEPPTAPPDEPTTPPRRSKGRGWLVVAALIVAVALVTGGYLAGAVANGRSGSGPASAPVPSGATPLPSDTGDEPVVAVAAALSPSVVQIQNQDGLGSGIVYDASGLIITNQHVVGAAKTVAVTLADGTRFDGQVLGADADHDIAVVRIKPGQTKLRPAKLASTTPVVGSITVAIGSPFGLSGTVTAGVVSALDRPVDNGRNVAVPMIQTDAPINPGNSGGALANRSGEVIGVNAEIASESGANSGIGFAIPIDTAIEIAHKITSGGSLARPALGVGVRDATGNVVGAQVASVTADSAAAKAGFKTGDVIVSLDGQKITSADQFRALLGRDEPGQTVRITVQRDGKTVTLNATLGKAS